MTACGAGRDGGTARAEDVRAARGNPSHLYRNVSVSSLPNRLNLRRAVQGATARDSKTCGPGVGREARLGCLACDNLLSVHGRDFTCARHYTRYKIEYNYNITRCVRPSRQRTSPDARPLSLRTDDDPQTPKFLNPSPVTRNPYPQILRVRRNRVSPPYPRSQTAPHDAQNKGFARGADA